MKRHEIISSVCSEPGCEDLDSRVRLHFPELPGTVFLTITTTVAFSKCEPLEYEIHIQSRADALALAAAILKQCELL